MSSAPQIPVAKEPQSSYTLRNALPSGLLLLVLALLFLSYVDSVVNGRSAVRARAREDAVLDAERLARVAQRGLKNNPAPVQSDLAVAATERRTVILALISPGGTVDMAHRMAWRGQAAASLIPHFSEERFLHVVQGRLPDVRDVPNQPRISVMVPFVSEGTAPGIRNDGRGVVYLEYDLSFEYALVQWSAQQRLWPLLAAALLTALGLAWVLRQRVTRPLARVEQASLALAQDGQAPPLEEAGPRELVRLAHAFNLMAARIRHAQRDSENSRARLSAIIEAAMDAIITVDQQQRIVVINGAALQMFGSTQEALLGQPLELLIPERLRQVHSAHIQRYAQKGHSERNMGHFLVVSARRMDGAEFPAEASISHITVDGATLLTVILRDVTEREKNQEAVIALNNTLEVQVAQRTARLLEATEVLEQQQRTLQLAHEEQRSIFNKVTVGIALVREHVILRSNRKLEELFGYGPGELDGSTTHRWYRDAETFAREGEPLFTDLQPGQTQVHEQELVRQDGSSFWARISGSRYVDGNLGRAVLAVFEDMSLQYRAQQAILEAKEQAEQASLAKSHFLANMSHEIRTPMNSIIGLSYLVLKSDLNARQREQIRKIQGSSQHLLSILNDILDYSKIEAGKLTVERIDFALEQVLDSVTNLVADKAAAKGLELLFQVDPKLPRRLVGDPLRLGQIIVNYANNAVKFTERGEVCIAISLREETAHDVLLRCTVTDSGIGLEPEQVMRLFQSFQQADNSTTRQYGGTGLGLAICKQLAALMQGEVGVDSVAGKGSSFWFTARLEKCQTPAKPLALRLDAQGTGMLALNGKVLQSIAAARVLLVEDNALNREVACDLLMDAGLAVDMAFDGQMALERLQHQPYDLVLMDMQMPVMDGLTATRKLRTMPEFAHLPIIAMTANAMASDRQLCLDAGMNDHVAKPIEPDVLFQTLLKWLPAMPARQPALAAKSSAPPAARVPTELPAIAGLDVANGLRRVRGKKDFYVRMLRKFAEDQDGTVAAMRADLQSGQRAEALRRAHTLKSLCASIGMVALSQQAAQMEAAIRADQTLDALEPDLVALELALQAFLRELERQLSSASHSAAPAANPDAQAVSRVCSKLAGLLADDNLEAVEWLTENEALLDQALGPSYARVADAVRRFDCALALSQLRIAAQSHGIAMNHTAGKS